MKNSFRNHFTPLHCNFCKSVSVVSILVGLTQSQMRSEMSVIEITRVRLLQPTSLPCEISSLFLFVVWLESHSLASNSTVLASSLKVFVLRPTNVQICFLFQTFLMFFLRSLRYGWRDLISTYSSVPNIGVGLNERETC